MPDAPPPAGRAEPRWLDREALARHICRRVDELPRLLRAGKLPPPSYHFGPRSPLWDREAVDAMIAGAAPAVAASVSPEEWVQRRVAKNLARQTGRARRPQASV